MRKLISVGLCAFLGWGVWSALAQSKSKSPVCLVGENGEAFILDPLTKKRMPPKVSTKAYLLIKERKRDSATISLDKALIEQKDASMSGQCRPPGAMKCEFISKSIDGQSAIHVRSHGDGWTSDSGPFSDLEMAIIGASKLIHSGNCKARDFIKICYLSAVQDQKNRTAGQALVIGNEVVTTIKGNLALKKGKKLLDGLVEKGFCVKFNPEAILDKEGDQNQRISDVPRDFELKEAKSRLQSFLKKNPANVPQ